MARFTLLGFLIIFCAQCSHTISAERRMQTIERTATTLKSSSFDASHTDSCLSVRGGGLFPAGWHPLGYKITSVGEAFLSFDGSLESDVGRFLGSLKKRVTKNTLKAYWLEIVRVAKTGQAMRIYRQIDKLLQFCF